MFIDLSIPIRKNDNGVEFEQWLHHEGARHLSRRTRSLPGDSGRQRAVNYWKWLVGSRRIRNQDLPGGCFLSNEFYRMTVHQGTHVDAPFHYGPQCEGSPAKKVGALPLDWFMGDGLVLDVRNCDGSVTRETVQKAIADSGATPGPGSIVLFRTDADLRLGSPAYYTESTAVTPEAVDELVDRGVKVLGTDCWSFDAPARRMTEDFYRTRDGSALWPTHLHGRDREFIQIEGLANLRAIPSGAFHVIAFPVALVEAGAAWCRAVAVTRDEL